MTDQIPPPPPPAPPVSSPPPAPASRSNKGCWFLGCGGCLGVVVLAMLGSYFFLLALQKDPHAEIVMTAPEQAALEAKISAVEGEAPMNLGDDAVRFTEKEMNAWIAQNDPELEDVLRIELSEDEFTAIFRMPHPTNPEKAFDFSAALRVEQNGDDVQVKLTRVKLGAFPVPRAWLGEFAREDFLEVFFPDEESRTQFLRGIKTIKITDDAFIFEPNNDDPVD